jgi:hypothetical protein
MRVVLADQSGIGTIDSVSHGGQVHDDVPAVAVDLPFEVPAGEYSVRAVFGAHGEFGVQLGDEAIVWIAVPAGVLEAAEERGLLAVVTDTAPDGTYGYFVIHWHRAEDAPAS